MLQGIDAVVNCVGVLQDGARDDVRRVQVEATTALFAACERGGVRRVIHISAIGASRGCADGIRSHQGGGRGTIWPAASSTG